MKHIKNSVGQKHISNQFLLGVLIGTKIKITNETSAAVARKGFGVVYVLSVSLGRCHHLRLHKGQSYFIASVLVSNYTVICIARFFYGTIWLLKSRPIINSRQALNRKSLQIVIPHSHTFLLGKRDDQDVLVILLHAVCSFLFMNMPRTFLIFSHTSFWLSVAFET